MIPKGPLSCDCADPKRPEDPWDVRASSKSNTQLELTGWEPEQTRRARVLK